MNYFKFILPFLFGVSGSSVSLAESTCSNVFDTQIFSDAQDSPTSPLANSLEQLEIRIIRAKELLEFAPPELTRKVLKLDRLFNKLLDNFEQNGKLSDFDLERIIDLSEELFSFEAKLNDLQLASSLDSSRLDSSSF